jgi:hypothetical protein
MEPPVFPLPSGQLVSKKKKDFANTKRTFEFRHHEYIHDKLWYNQYGLQVFLRFFSPNHIHFMQALAGGMLEPNHYALIRAAINRNMNDQRFAVWRVEVANVLAYKWHNCCSHPGTRARVNRRA